MKLLIVTQTLDKNDSNLGFFHSWILGFAKRFEAVTVIALNVGAHDMPSNVTVHSLGKESGVGPVARAFRYIGLLVRVRHEYTHVFAHMNPEYVIGAGLIWRFLGKKIGFWYVHGAVSVRLRIAEIFTHKIFTASKESCRMNSKKITVVGHGINTEIFKPAPAEHAPTIASIGRISPSKQLEIIVETHVLLKEKIPLLRSYLIGSAGSPEETGYAENIKIIAEKAGVTVAPPMPHAKVSDFLANSDVFLNASTTGSLDKAVLEAMACGVIPVTSNAAFKNTLSPLGLFVEARAENFAEVAMRVLNDSAQRSRLSHAVREEVVGHHSFERLMDLLLDSYKSL